MGNGEKLPVLFVGTKLDLAEDIMVDADYAQQFQETFNLFDYTRISSKTGEGVAEAFERLTFRILERQNL